MNFRRARFACWSAAAALLLLAGCAGTPRKPAAPDAPVQAPGADGPRVSPYAPAQEDPSTRGDYVAGGLYKPGVADSLPDYVPDADAIPEPEVVALPRSRYGNGPAYKVLGRTYRVLDDPDGFVETGLASYYGQKFHGRRTSSQEVYDMYAFTAAHKSLPLPSFARVTNLENGRSVVVRVNDRGPFHDGRVVDLSYAAAVKIGVHPRGTARVEVRALSPGEDARHRPDTRVAAVDAAGDNASPVQPTAPGALPVPAPASALDGLVAALPAAAAVDAPAAAAAAAAPAETEASSHASADGDGDWRFDMTQDGRAMTADEFDAWMKARRARVATGRAGKPEPRAPVAPVPAAAAAAGSAVAGPATAGTAATTAPIASSQPPSTTAAHGALFQVAAFGSRDNAERALAMLRGAGIAGARLQDGTAAGKPVWRLRVGPVAPGGVADLRDRVAGLGFSAPQPVRE